MFDGSSIRGFQQIHESDMQLLPDPATARSTCIRTHKTLNLTFFVHDPLTGAPYSRDPRNVARKAQDFLRGTGSGTRRSSARRRESTSSTRPASRPRRNLKGYYHIYLEGAWNTGKDEDGGNLVYKPRYKGGYFPVPPMDHYTDLRSEMVRNLIAGGIQVVCSTTRSAWACEAEIDIRFGCCWPWPTR